MRKRNIIVLLALALFAMPAQPQFLRQLGKELKKTAEEAARQAVDDLLGKDEKAEPQKQQTTATTATTTEAASTVAEIPTIKFTETSFYAVRITNDTKFLKIPNYATVSDVYDGIFSVTSERGDVAFFYEDGTMLFDYIWKEIGNFAPAQFDNGVCLMRSKEKVGTRYPLCILYRDGRVKQLPTEYYNGTQFVDGIARLQKQTASGNVWVYINAAGKEIYPNLTEKCGFGGANSTGELSDGLRPHYSYADKKWGYIDAQGNVVIKPQFATARPFSEGLAAVQVEENYVKKWGFIDRTGAFAIPAQYGGYGKISDCRNGYITWRDWDNSQDLFIDKTGKVAATYKSATPFLNGYALVKPLEGENSETLDNMLVIDTNFRVVGTSPIKYIDKNDAMPDGLAHGAGVYSISGGGGNPFVMLPNGRVVIRLWDEANQKSMWGHIGTYTDDLRAQVRFTIPRNVKENGEPIYYEGFIDETGKVTLVYTTDALTQIIDPVEEETEMPEMPEKPEMPEIPTPPTPGPIPEPGPGIGEEPPIIYPIIVEWVSQDDPVGPTVVDEPSYSVTTVADPPEGGTVTGAGTYKYGDPVKITATANEGWKLTGITCNDPLLSIDGTGGEVMHNGKDLTFTATFIKRDTIETISNTGIYACESAWNDSGTSIPFTAYLEMSKDNNISTAYGENTSGFLTAIVDPNQNYPFFFNGASSTCGAVGGQLNAKFFFVPMRVTGTMTDAATGKRYLVADGGQFMAGGVNVDCTDPFMNLYLNFVMSYNGNTFATISNGRYRIEMLDVDESTGEFTLGMMERFSPVYGWLPSDDDRLRSKPKTAGWGFFPQKDPEGLMMPWLFSGCRMKPAEKRDDVQWTPPADWFESRNLFEAVCKRIGEFMGGMKTDYETFWGE